MMSIWEFLSPRRSSVRRASQSSLELVWFLRIGALFLVACGAAHDGHFNRTGLLPSGVADAHVP